MTANIFHVGLDVDDTQYHGSALHKDSGAVVDFQCRFGITKQGNRYLRTAFIEANKRGYRTTRVSQELKTRRTQCAPEFVDTADRCLHRLSKKGDRLLLAGKHPNRVKVACAREAVGVVWESLHKAAA